MPSFREIKRKARIQLHTRLSDLALYLTGPTETPLPVTVRLHLSFNPLGDLLRGGFAEREEATPSIIFMRDQVQPGNKGILITKDMGAWKIDHDFPPDDITIKAEVSRLADGQVTDFGWSPGVDWLGFPEPEPLT